MQQSFLMQFLLVGAGGFLGSGLRYSVAVWMQRILPNAQFPFATLTVNVLGCFLIGLVAAYRPSAEPGVRLFLMVGMLGGFTTFSAFALETLVLTHQENYTLAFLNVALKLLLGLGAAWAGFELGRVFAS